MTQLIPAILPRTQPLLGPVAVGDTDQVLASDGFGGTYWATPDSGGVTDHGLLAGLLDDDHTQYVRIDGRVGGQTITGGTGASQNLTLQSTLNATKGVISVLNNMVFENNVGVQGKNTSGTVRDLIKMTNGNVTSISSFDGGGVIRLMNGAAVVAEASNGGFGVAAGTAANTSIRTVNGGANFGIYVDASFGFGYASNGSSLFEVMLAGGITYTRIGTGHFVAGSSVANRDVGFRRDAAGVWRVSDGDTGYGQIDGRLRNYTTGGRPAAGNVGRTIFDTTLGIPIFDNGTSWVKADGTAA